jgi:hypothetical protein
MAEDYSGQNTSLILLWLKILQKFEVRSWESVHLDFNSLGSVDVIATFYDFAVVLKGLISWHGL